MATTPWLQTRPGILAEIDEQRRRMQVIDTEMAQTVAATLDTIAQSRLILAEADKILDTE